MQFIILNYENTKILNMLNYNNFIIIYTFLI